jgi:hypothetical protein
LLVLVEIVCTLFVLSGDPLGPVSILVYGMVAAYATRHAIEWMVASV